MNTTTLDERKTTLAGTIGEEADQITMISLDIAKMRDLGVLVDIDVHGTSMFTARATWAELGIPQEDTRRRRLKRGSKDLVPRRYIGQIRSLETRFRQSLEKHSFVLQGFRPYRWVPFTAHKHWREEWSELQAELAELKEEIIAHHDEFVDALASDFTKIAYEAWDAVRARRPAGAGEFALITDNGTFDSVDSFIDHVISHAVALLPSQERIKHDLFVDYKNALVVAGADLEAEHLRKEKLHTEWVEERAKQDATRAEANTRREQEEARQCQLRLETNEAERSSNIRLSAMREAELEHARQQLQSMVSPFTEVFEQFRARIHQDVAEIAASVNKNGHLRGKVAERARGLLDLYRLLGAATGDDELETALTELRGRLSQQPVNNGAGKYDTQAVVSALSDIATLTHDAAQSVISRSDAHTRAGALEL